MTDSTANKSISPTPEAPHHESLLGDCVSVDLEVHSKTNDIMSFAGVMRHGGSDKSIVYRKKHIESRVDGSAADKPERMNLLNGLEGLDRFSKGAKFLLGHNIVAFDAEHLRAKKPDLGLLVKPMIDTLWLNPLAFPRNPYHHLVKHYQDGRLQGGHINDPEQDAMLVLTVLSNQISELVESEKIDARLNLAYHFLTTTRGSPDGFDAVFVAVRGDERPDKQTSQEAVSKLLHGNACMHQIEKVFAEATQDGWPLAYALAWIAVAGENSVMPPWVRHQFPEASKLVRRLRDTPCGDSACPWCESQNNPKVLLQKHFGYPEFRPEPAGADGQSLQENITANTMAKHSILGILPTGTGKSICYQLPALAQFEKTGALTVVISPLVALMADQVAGMQKQGISSCVTVNGTLSLPERQDALDQVRLGDAAILLISPEQLRSPSVDSVLKQREVGYWVLDEAHCVSKWGHDFRPDYRYIARYIHEYSGDEPPAPLVCLTATAKPDVVRDITDHFQDKLGLELKLVDGGSVRTNLSFEVIPTNKNSKHNDVIAVLTDSLSDSGNSGAIIYCSTRNGAERVAHYLKEHGFAADYYHAKRKPEEKSDVQNQFFAGELRVVAATNAFGMGIDKPDVRLVVHADIPASLENYLQEAGRAGRDQEQAHCVLLFSHDDIERQFSLSARSRLDKREIGAILKALRRMDRSSKQEGIVVATPGEIVKEEKDREFGRDQATDDTRVKTAVSWLEEAVLLQREMNQIHVYPSSLKVRTLVEAKALLDKADFAEGYRSKLITLVQSLMNSPPDEGVSTDDLCGVTGFTSQGIKKAIYDLEALGIASNDTNITVYVHIGVKDSSDKRLADICSIESDLIEKFRELAPDLSPHESSPLNLRYASHELQSMGHGSARPDIVEQLVRGIARDGRDEDDGIGSFRIRKTNRESLSVYLLRSWDKLDQTARLRRSAAGVLLRSLRESAPSQAQGKDIQVETTLGSLTSALMSDMELNHQIKNPTKLLDRALLWMHEQRVITLGKGLTVFRPAITVHLNQGNNPFTKADFEPLQMHYKEQVMQIHIMTEYACIGIESIPRAAEFAKDYFMMGRSEFIAKWLSNRGKGLQRQTTPETWKAIVENLKNPQQQRIVTDDREQVNTLILAGPGSGKTRVLVHRIAHLVRVQRQDPLGILVLVYNRHAATDIRKRLIDLIGEDAYGVTISTCHGFAMRIVGASFAGRAEQATDDAFAKILQQAVSLIKGEGLTPDEAEDQRNLLIEGYRWILVDEYQDIGPDEYDLIAGVAGRTIDDPDLRLSLFAVGDDDQNIYSFKGASMEYIRRFEQDYKAKREYLTENYRSTGNIIRAANRVISFAAERMKTGYDITVNRKRKDTPNGGNLEQIDTVGRGRVQVIKSAGDSSVQAVLAVEELQRISKLLADEWSWNGAAIIAREWKYLEPVRSYCEFHGIPVQSAGDSIPNFWRLREMQETVKWLKSRERSALNTSDFLDYIKSQSEGAWWDLLREGADDLVNEFGKRETDRASIIEWLVEWSRDARRRQAGLLLLTAHSAKGLEFDDVVVLDGGWEKQRENEDRDATRRLYYVAMTRAKRSLALLSMGDRHHVLGDTSDHAFLVRDQRENAIDTSACKRLYQKPKVDLGFAGRMGDRNSSLAAIGKLKAGDKLFLKHQDGKWVLADSNDTVVCHLVKGYSPPENMRFAEGKAYAVSVRRSTDGENTRKLNTDGNKAVTQEGVMEQPPEKYLKPRRDEWQVVLPELVFHPME